MGEYMYGLVLGGSVWSAWRSSHFTRGEGPDAHWIEGLGKSNAEQDKVD